MKEKAWHSQAIELKAEGKSNYEIARQLWGRGSMESTVRYFFKSRNLPVQSNAPKILYWDIETAPFLSLHYNKWGENIGNAQHITEKFLMSHSWAWNDGAIEGVVMQPDEAKKQDDLRIVAIAWDLLDAADIVIAHNGKRFDIKMINGFFLRHGFPPPSPYKVIDTLRIARKHFKLTSNSLAYLATLLGVPAKLDSGGWEAARKSYYGDEEALKNLLTYNFGDIDTLREVYKKLRSWGNDGVNMAVYSDDGFCCPSCASTDLRELIGKFQYTSVSKFQLLRCNDCNAIARFKKSIKTETQVVSTI